MMSTAKQGNVLLTVLAAAVAFGFHAGRAEAQWGMGFGGGMYGFGGFTTVPQPVDFLNSVALSQMSHVRGPRGTNPYAGNPNAYFNHVRRQRFRRSVQPIPS
jgi:hypothetical protein